MATCDFRPQKNENRCFFLLINVTYRIQQCKVYTYAKTREKKRTGTKLMKREWAMPTTHHNAYQRVKNKKQQQHTQTSEKKCIFWLFLEADHLHREMSFILQLNTSFSCVFHFFHTFLWCARVLPRTFRFSFALWFRFCLFHRACDRSQIRWYFQFVDPHEKSPSKTVCVCVCLVFFGKQLNNLRNRREFIEPIVLTSSHTYG